MKDYTKSSNMNGSPDNEDYYLDHNGLLVFTEAFLLRRGYCCGSGCRHCPYDYAAVPEPKKSLLLKQRKEGQEKNKDAEES